MQWLGQRSHSGESPFQQQHWPVPPPGPKPPYSHHVPPAPLLDSCPASAPPQSQRLARPPEAQLPWGGGGEEAALTPASRQRIRFASSVPPEDGEEAVASGPSGPAGLGGPNPPAAAPDARVSPRSARGLPPRQGHPGGGSLAHYRGVSLLQHGGSSANMVAAGGGAASGRRAPAGGLPHDSPADSPRWACRPSKGRPLVPRLGCHVLHAPCA
jgi:hypothetical protein